MLVAEAVAEFGDDVSPPSHLAVAYGLQSFIRASFAVAYAWI